MVSLVDFDPRTTESEKSNHHYRSPHLAQAKVAPRPRTVALPLTAPRSAATSPRSSPQLRLFVVIKLRRHARELMALKAGGNHVDLTGAIARSFRLAHLDRSEVLFELGQELLRA